MFQLDILIPVYNESENIIKVIETLRCAVKTPYRILICYDHDEDSTLTVLKKYEYCHLVNIKKVKNKGGGVLQAVLTGFRNSEAPAIIVFPADDTFNAGIIDQMFQKFTEGCQIVAASRFMKGGCMKGCPWLKALLVRTAAFTLYHLARLPTHDPTSGFKLFSRQVVDNIEIESEQGWAFSIELVVKCHRLGWKIGEVPALWFERTQGQSRFRVFKWLPIYLRWYFFAFVTTYLRNRQKSQKKRAKS